MTMRYKVVLVRSEEGVSVSVPGLPGCWSQGTTDEEALDNIPTAIHESLSVVAAGASAKASTWSCRMGGASSPFLVTTRSMRSPWAVSSSMLVFPRPTVSLDT